MVSAGILHHHVVGKCSPSSIAMSHLRRFNARGNGPGTRRQARQGSGVARALGLLAVLSALFLRPAFGETIPEPVALLEGLDKITARVSKFEAPVGAPVRFGTLSIRVRDCEKNPPEEAPESAAFVVIDETRPGEEKRRLFSGWMFASSPALSALEHPVYDVTLLDCKATSGSPRAASGSDTGKEAR
jgi:hypothetical protein